MSDDTGDIDGTVGELHDGGGSGAVLGGPGAAAGGPGGGGGSCRDSAAAVGPAGAAGARGGEPASAGLSLRGLRGAARVTAVDGVDLDVSRGETVALLGPSGCGKSSLLRAVAGLEDLAGGTVMWDGRDVVRVPVHRRGFGLMLQDGQLFPFRDVAGNVAYGLTGLPRRERRPRVEEMLELVGLPGYGPRDIATLSGGQAQRVALARSLAPRPRLLLLDEPLRAHCASSSPSTCGRSWPDRGRPPCTSPTTTGRRGWWPTGSASWTPGAFCVSMRPRRCGRTRAMRRSPASSACRGL